jgi:hypothetical protein
MASDSDTDNSDDFYSVWNPYSSGESEFEGFSEDDIGPYTPIQPTFPMEQSESDRENALDIAYGWIRDDSPPTVAPFTGSTAISLLLRLVQ